MDLAYTYDLDLDIQNNKFQLQVDGEATTISAFFSDDRYNNQRGYWLEILNTDLWRYDQSRILDNTLSDIQETCNNISKKLVEQGLYNKLTATVSLDGMYVVLLIQGYNDNNMSFNRKFTI